METLPAKKNKTPQSLVHIKHTLTEFQYKCWYLMLRNMKNKLENGGVLDDEGFVYLKISDLNSDIGYEINKKILKKDLDEIRKQSIVLNYLEKDGKPVAHGIGFISEWKIVDGKIGYKVSSIISNALLSPEKNMFLLMDWDIFNSFKGKYEGIIYKLCKDYAGVGKTIYFTLDRLRGYMGFDDTEYTEFKRLNEKVLKPSIEAINTNSKSDLTVELNLNREARKVVGLHFTIKSKVKEPVNNEISKNDDDNSAEPTQKTDVEQAFSAAKITPSKTLEKYLDIYTVEQIQYCIQAANTYIDNEHKKGNKTDIGKIYNSALKGNWGDNLQKEAKAEAEKKAKQKEAAEQEQQNKIAAEKAKKEAAEQMKAEKAMLAEIFDSLTNEQQSELCAAVRQNIPAPQTGVFDSNSKNNSAITHPFFLAEFKKQIKEMFAFDIEQLLTN